MNNVRSLSQTLHPSILEELGLDSTFDWYLGTVEKQLGLAVSYERTGAVVPVDTTIGIHVYRVLQEALSNVSRHSGRRPRVGAPALPSRRARARGGGSWFGSRGADRAARARPGRHARARRARRRYDRVRAARRGRYARPASRAARGAGQPAVADAVTRQLEDDTMDKITVLLADDHHLVRRGFRRMLEDDPDLRVVGEASDGDEAVRLALSL